MRAKKPKITVRQNPGGSKSYCVDAGLIHRKRHRKCFATKAEAETYSEQVQISKRNSGVLAFALSEKQRVDASEALKVLEPLGVSLGEAAAFYVRLAKPKGGPKTCKDVAAEVILSKTRSGKRPRYVKALRVAFGRFNESFSKKLIHEVLTSDIQKWLDSEGFSMITRRNYIRDLGILWAFAVQQGYCAENAARTIEYPTLDDTPPAILTIDQCVSLLNAAADSHPELLPYVAVGLFAGLRSSEIEALNWEEIDFSSRTIEVKAAKSKTRKRRLVDISDALEAWLLPYQGATGNLVSRGWRDRFQKLTKAAGFSKWPANALRHSFASYHLAKYRNAHSSALQLGHSKTETLFAHYRELVKPFEADKYWTLSPEQPSNLLKVA
jgi:integrase